MTVPKRASVVQERRVAEELGGRVQPGSGAPQFYKGDVRKAGDIRVECKTTGTKGYRLTLAELQKIQSEALTGGEENWAMQIEFQGQFTNKKFAVIDWDTFVQLREDQAVAKRVHDNITNAIRPDNECCENCRTVLRADGSGNLYCPECR